MKQKFIEWFTKNNNGCSPAMEDDRSFVREKTQHMFEAYQAGVAEGEARYAALAVENAGLKDFVKTCFRAAADGASLDGADIQELGERLGLFGRETYQPVLHGYICGHDAGEDTVYVMKKTPATDAFLAEMRAQAKADGVQEYADSFRHSASKIRECHGDTIRVRALLHEANNADEFAAQLRKGVQS
ncbi:hypothetical protein [Enterobacter soli]|uniref:Uncharacterized protein n=1 Tax=Enterobacter soli TaxID=885040 RepID=A0AAW8H4B6_9ENTR|nr:hypothetical protein [Enterobacter soli]MDQ2255068.1 hypothetical protein [Enterobacter soli]MDQ2336987.1 hypothetical protein [Enterobacter soli]